MFENVHCSIGSYNWTVAKSGNNLNVSQQGYDLVSANVPILENICSYFKGDELAWRDVYINWADKCV